MDQNAYKLILQNHMMPHARRNMPGNWIFMDDNDPKHRAASVTSYIQRQHVRTLGSPPQSPDLNLIENFWGYMKDRLRSIKSRNENELWANLQKLWDTIDEEFIGKQIQSMQNRCRAVIKSKGGPTKY